MWNCQISNKNVLTYKKGNFTWFNLVVVTYNNSYKQYFPRALELFLKPMKMLCVGEKVKWGQVRQVGAILSLRIVLILQTPLHHSHKDEKAIHLRSSLIFAVVSLKDPWSKPMDPLNYLLENRCSLISVWLCTLHTDIKSFPPLHVSPLFTISKAPASAF